MAGWLAASLAGWLDGWFTTCPHQVNFVIVVGGVNITNTTHRQQQLALNKTKTKQQQKNPTKVHLQAEILPSQFTKCVKEHDHLTGGFFRLPPLLVDCCCIQCVCCPLPLSHLLLLALAYFPPTRWLWYVCGSFLKWLNIYTFSFYTSFFVFFLFVSFFSWIKVLLWFYCCSCKLSLRLAAIEFLCKFMM